MFGRLSILFIGFLFVSSCAQQVPPNGGARDTVNPKVLGSRPENKSTFFEADKIVIRFDEYIQIKDPSQIVISPFLKDKPTIDANGKTIEVHFMRSKPEKNTTYTINFGNSIVDVNEGNILGNYSYVFSTGSFLDSNSFSGSVKNAFDLKPQKDIVIGLYKKAYYNDTILPKIYPNYFSKSLENGQFRIENLPDDSFFLVAFKDANADNKFQKSENVAFNTNIVVPRFDSNYVELMLFETEHFKTNSILDSFSRQKGKFQFVVYKPEQIKIKPINRKYFLQQLIGKDETDTFNFFIPNNIDSIPVQFEIQRPDTVFKVSLKTKNRGKIPEFNLQIIPPNKPNDSIHILFNIPIDSFFDKRIELKEDTLLLKTPLFGQKSDFEWFANPTLTEGKVYKLLIPDSSMKNIYGRYNKKTEATFSAVNPKDFGNLILHIDYNLKDPILFQIIEDSPEEKIVREITGKIPKEINIENLKPGSYKLKIILDANNNLKWDNGNFLQKVQPEKVFYFGQAIMIKAYWDVEQSINIDSLIKN